MKDIFQAFHSIEYQCSKSEELGCRSECMRVHFEWRSQHYIEELWGSALHNTIKQKFPIHTEVFV